MILIDKQWIVFVTHDTVEVCTVSLGYVNRTLSSTLQFHQLYFSRSFSTFLTYLLCCFLSRISTQIQCRQVRTFFVFDLVRFSLILHNVGIGGDSSGILYFTAELKVD